MKGILSSEIRVEVEKLQQEEAILDFEMQNVKLFCRWNYNRIFSRWNCSEVTADLAANNTVRHGLH